VPADLMQNAIVIATFAYQAANRDALFPRNTMPAAPPGGIPGMPPTGAPAPGPATSQQ